MTPTRLPTTTPAATPVNSSSNSNSRDDLANKVLVTKTDDVETADDRIRNAEAIAKIREAWVYKQVRERVGEFTEYKRVSLL